MKPDDLHVILGTGPVGLAISRDLAARGAAVRMVNRSGKLSARGVELLQADLFDPAEVRRVTRGAAVVYSTAQPAYHQWVTRFPALQSAILDGTAASGAVLVVMENVYMYGAAAGPLTEETPFRPNSRKGEVRARMAEQVSAAHRSGKLRTVQVRAADFYGPWVRESTLGARQIEPIPAGKKSLGMGSIDQPHSFTYIDDIGRAMVRVGMDEQAHGQAWHVPNAPAQTQREVLTTCFELAGRQPRVGSMGRGMLRLGGLFIPAARESIEMLYQFEQPFVVDGSRFERAFGQPATPLREGLRCTMEWWKEQGSESGQ